ncbi:MAG: RNA polymerase sigma-70 factor [Flavobacteriaceae bacterium]|nr:RNA polymerase sigma-70 factor [Flavobacteriaceae bacterium]
MNNKFIKNITNHDLMNRIKQSDERALEILFDRLWDSMYVLAFSILEDKNIAKDMVQEVWISFWERREKIENDKIEAYLFKAVRFRVYKELRDSKMKNYHRKYIEQIPTSNNIDDALNFFDANNLIHKTIDALPKRCGQVFKLSRFEGLKNIEIADQLGISRRTVETHISNAIKQIKSKVALFLWLFFLNFMF